MTAPTDIPTDTTLVTLSGDFDAQEVTLRRDSFEQLIDLDHQRVAVEMSAVTFIDSSGIGALVFLFKRLTAKGKKLALLGVNGQPQELLKQLRIDRTIKCYPDITSLK